nr:hypothetical protein [uncultured Gellertiella sp.]
MTFTLIALVIIIALGFAGWSMISEAARGQRWIILSRRSSRSPESIWHQIEERWSTTALTFEPVRILPDSTELMKNFSLVVDDREFRTSLMRMPPQKPRSLTITCVSANGRPFPLGKQHRKIWQVEPDGTGALIRVAVTFQAPPAAILQAIFTFRHQLSLLASA